MTIAVRLAQNEDGPRIGELVYAMGYRLEGMDWSDIYPYWLVAEQDGRVIGCIQVLPGKPVGRLELMGIDKGLGHRTKGEAVERLLTQGMATLQAMGARAMDGFVPFAYTGYKRALKKRGGVAVAQGNMIVKRFAGILVAMVVLSACASSGVVTSWKGANVNDLIMAWGGPDRDYRMPDGGRELKYTHLHQSDGTDYDCTAVFRVSPSGVVSSASYDGTLGGCNRLLSAKARLVK